MRLKQYITEAKKPDIDRIKVECAKYIKEIDGNAIYHGSKRKLDGGIQKMKSRVTTGRNPRLIKPEIHRLLNELFTDKFGWPVRNGVMTTSSVRASWTFGESYMFMPIGDYQYVWGEDIDDFNDSRSNAKLRVTSIKLDLPDDIIDNVYDGFQGIRQLDISRNPNEYTLLFKTFIDKYYHDDTLQKAVADQCEISFNCDEYYLMESIIYDKVMR